MANIYDIAQEAGVSIATVSKAFKQGSDIGETTRQKILKIAEKNNYAPNSVARSLTTNESQLIGVFFNSSLDEGLHNMFFQEVIFGMERKLGPAGYDYVYFSDQKWHDNNRYDYLGKCKDRLVDGAILLGVSQSERMQALLESDLPVVLIDLQVNNEFTTYVRSKHKQAAREVVDYLYNKGHEKIGIITGPTDINPIGNRLEGYQEMVEEFNLPQRESWLVETNFKEADGFAAMEKLINLDDRPTAVFCQSDALAIGALKAVKEAGLSVPEDFSLVGFDNIELSQYVEPALTTVGQHSYRIGEEAVEQLLKMVRSSETGVEPVELETELIERESCRQLS
jgi:LacI family transcriptional regulator/LacI family purine nucleotide synthesis repressor